MRLINTKTLELHEFFNDNVPPYAILSHTWGTEEVTFQDWQNHQVAVSKQGYLKIKNACRKSLNKRLEWLWVDTNCIDKTSSAELTEAINSMFAYYQNSQVCFAYLADVPTSGKNRDVLFSQIRGSRWFTRGWTLQELIAPRRLVFYAADWSRIDRNDKSLVDLIASITNIDRQYLNGQRSISEASVSKRMSWLANRITTRTEDMAYCMLGIFGISMPLLYGEGKQAFLRLQEEIIKSSNDHTIFCWEWVADIPYDWGSLLAPWPTAFKRCGGFERLESDDISIFSMTNAGLSIRLPTITALGRKSDTASWFVMLQAGPAGTIHSPTEAACIRVSGRQAGDLLYVSRSPYPGQPMTISRPLIGHFKTESLIVMNRLASGSIFLKSRAISQFFDDIQTVTFIPVLCPQTLQSGWHFDSLWVRPSSTIIDVGNSGVVKLMFSLTGKDEKRLFILLGARINDGCCYPMVKIVTADPKKAWLDWGKHVERSTSGKQETDFCESLGVTAALKRSINIIRSRGNFYFLFLQEGGFADSGLIGDGFGLSER